jgi:putative protease
VTDPTLNTACHPPPIPEPEHNQSVVLPELLAPAGDWDCVRAAIENGADAIYFGLEHFNARMRAQNFTEADLPKLMEFLHRRGVKGYVTLNTLVFQNELPRAERYLRAMIAAGVDAVIVQDVGICQLVRRLSPDFPIHASTQMTITSPGGVAFAKELGCNLVVLARECSLKEIEQIQANQSGLGSRATGGQNNPIPLEVFVHGALCVAYSGQCLTSEALGGRSANRGECAQACRLPYELISDGTKVPLGDRRYLLSPQDLAGLEVLPQLVRLGIASLKIEGRLKSPEYVANVTGIYRKALDTLRAPGDESPAGHRSGCPASGSSASRFPEITEQARYDLQMAFSRGLSTGWFGGINNQKLVHARFGKKRGVYLGQVERVLKDRVLVALQEPLKPGDGVVFDAGHPEAPEEGGRVYEVQGHGPKAFLTFGHGRIDFQRIHPGDRVWKTSDPELDRRLQRSFSAAQPQFQQPIDIEVHGRAGGPLTVIARDEAGHLVQVSSSVPLAAAETQPLTTARLREQLGRLGGTPFRLDRLENQLEGNVMLPVSELNRLRREWASQLETRRAQPRRWTLTPASDGWLSQIERVSASHRPLHHPSSPELVVLVRDLAQLDAALELHVQTVYCDFEDPKRYREAVQRFRAWPADSPTKENRRSVFVAPPRIFKAGEDWVLKQVRSSDADGYLVRNYDHLGFFAGCRCVGDYSLNVANALAADYFKQRFGLERVTASYDLDQAQLKALLSAAPPDWFEVTIHQHMPMFHMEHCVFCAFLSTGTDYTNCGRPCDKHKLDLLDRVGARHPVKADAGCRNTVFNALAQTGAEHLESFRQLGVRHFRLEFLNESPEVVRQTIRQYRRVLAGEMNGADLWRELKLLHQLGVTRGQAVPKIAR